MPTIHHDEWSIGTSPPAATICFNMGVHPLSTRPTRAAADDLPQRHQDAIGDSTKHGQDECYLQATQ